MSLKPKKVSEIKKIQEKMYSKTREDLFDVLSEKSSLEDAKKRARKMYQEFLDAKISSMSAMVPATRVFELVEELEGYLNNWY